MRVWERGERVGAVLEEGRLRGHKRSSKRRGTPEREGRARHRPSAGQEGRRSPVPPAFGRTGGAHLHLPRHARPGPRPHGRRTTRSVRHLPAESVTGTVVDVLQGRRTFDSGPCRNRAPFVPTHVEGRLSYSTIVSSTRPGNGRPTQTLLPVSSGSRPDPVVTELQDRVCSQVLPKLRKPRTPSRLRTGVKTSAASHQTSGGCG